MAEVRAWLEAKVASLQFATLVSAILALIVRMRDLNSELTRRLAHVQRARPRSERLGPLKDQLALALSIEIVAAKKLAPTPNTKAKRSRRGVHPGRGALPPHLDRVPDFNLVPAEKRVCPVCGCEMTHAGFSPVAILDVSPAKLFVCERQDEWLACVHDDTIVAAEPPPQLVPRGKLGRTLIIEALADKYLDHLPIERQCLRLARAGVTIAPQTLGRSVAVAIDRLMPIAALIVKRTRGPGLLATDATSIPVLDRDAPEGIRLGTIWAWTNARWVSFVYAPNGSGDSVRSFLGDVFARVVQCDGTNITSFLEKAGGKRPGCWAHGRRRFAAAARGGDLLALEALELIAELAVIEKAATLAGDSADQRKARRLAESAPVLERLRLWLDEKRGVIPPKTPLGKPLGYLHRQWKRLNLFLEDGGIELTNNRRERELRKLVLGRRNWLFVWEDLGGERTAAILTIVASCVSHDINPRAYLHLVAKLIVEGWPPDRLDELLPDRIAGAHPQLLARAPTSPALAA